MEQASKPQLVRADTKEAEKKEVMMVAKNKAFAIGTCFRCLKCGRTTRTYKHNAWLGRISHHMHKLFTHGCW